LFDILENLAVANKIKDLWRSNMQKTAKKAKKWTRQKRLPKTLFQAIEKSKEKE